MCICGHASWRWDHKRTSLEEYRDLSIEGLKQWNMVKEDKSLPSVEKYEYLTAYNITCMEGFIRWFGYVGHRNNSWRCVFTLHQATTILGKD